MLILLSVLMFMVAVVFSMLGQGGGTLYTPIQVWLGIDFHIAATTSLFLITIMSLSASIVFRKAKKIDWPLALVLETATATGGFLGGFWSERFSGAALSVIFAVVVVMAAFFMIRSIDISPTCRREGSSFIRWKRIFGDEHYSVNLLIALPVSFVAGLVSGMIGIGGGVMKVPMMVLLFGLPMDIAVGCSAFMVGLTAAGGFVGHLINGHWDWEVSLVLAVVVFIGAQIGSRMSLGIDNKKLKKGFGWFLLCIAAIMILRLY